MHTFGHPADVKGLTTVADKWRLTPVEDLLNRAVSILATYRHLWIPGQVSMVIRSSRRAVVAHFDDDLGRWEAHYHHSKMPHSEYTR